METTGNKRVQVLAKGKVLADTASMSKDKIDDRLRTKRVRDFEETCSIGVTHYFAEGGQPNLVEVWHGSGAMDFSFKMTTAQARALAVFLTRKADVLEGLPEGGGAVCA